MGVINRTFFYLCGCLLSLCTDFFKKCKQKRRLLTAELNQTHAGTFNQSLVKRDPMPCATDHKTHQHPPGSAPGPLVSVILPTYNRAWSLGSAIDSVLAQDYPCLELIVIDDGSTDGTADLLKTYEDRLTVIRQANKGVSAARNAGIRRSSGEYIALIDSDDTWDSHKISCQVAFFESHPEALICQTGEVWIRNHRRVNPKKKHRKPSGMIFEPSLWLCLVSPSAVMIKKELLDQKGLFDETLMVCEDYDLWLRISHDTPVYLIDEPYTIKYGGHPDQLSASHSQDKFRIRSLTRLIETEPLSPEQVIQARAVLKEKCRIYGTGCIKRGKTEEGRYYLLMSERS